MSTELVHQPGRKPISPLPTAEEWALMNKIADILIAGKMIPAALDTPAKAMSVMLMGRELGLGPFESCRSIHTINGKPSLSAELMQSLTLTNIPSFEFAMEQSTDQLCKVKGRRSPTHEFVSITFTRQDAERAGLLGKGVWKQYPQAMLRARAISALCRVLAPDAIRGCYTAEELGRDDVADLEANTETRSLVTATPITVDGTEENQDDGSQRND